MVVLVPSTKTLLSWTENVHTRRRNRSELTLKLHVVGIAWYRRRSKDEDCRWRQSRFASLEVRSERGKAGIVPSIAKGTDRHFILAEWWPEARRRGKREESRDWRRRRKKRREKERKERGL
ncbi:hypothetical protein JCGZ_10345 [Jatropha curcas]|uniref:Uncharacterized protein n=1 Tax=Jatropha curcas TaxID=180498 RepID=A0A067KGK6_JATCU|nr:hypothetical protein JCGZ_10345 [Jatropha curcas]